MGDFLLTPAGQLLALLGPELLLLLAALVMLALARLPDVAARAWMPRVALAGLLLALATLLLPLEATTGSAYGLRADPFAQLARGLALGVTFCSVLLSGGYLRRRRLAPGPYYALLLFFGLFLSLLALVVDLALVVLCLGALHLVGCLLVACTGALGSAFRTWLYGAALIGLLLFGSTWLYGGTGATNMATMAELLVAEGPGRAFLLPGVILVGAGLAFTIAAVPFHPWAFGAAEADSGPVVALLTVGLKVAGFTLLLRVTALLLPASLRLGGDWRVLLTALAAVTIVIGNVLALGQTRTRGLFAALGVAQGGYLLLGLLTDSVPGTVGLLLSLLAYALAMLGAFAVVTALAGADEFEAYAGLHRRSPLLALGMLLCLLALGGVPLTLGFVGRLWLFSAVIETGALWLAVVGLLGSVLTLAAGWRLVRALYVLPPAVEGGPVTVSPPLWVVLGLAVVGLVLLGLAPGLLLPALARAASALCGG